MTKPTDIDEPNRAETKFQELEENLNASFRASANEPSAVDLTRIKARAESIPAGVSAPQTWLRALLVGACATLALITFQNLERSEPLLDEKHAAAMETNREGEKTLEIDRGISADSKSSKTITADSEEVWDEEALHYLEIGWEEDYELDMLHGIPNVEETALLLTAYESL